MATWRDHWPTILESVSQGATLRATCKTLQLSESTVRTAIGTDPDLAAQYAHAREAQAAAWGDAIVDEADGEPQRDPESGRIDPAWVNWQRLRVDTRKWVAARAHPAGWGDKVDVTSGGEKVSGVIMLPPAQSE